MMKDNGIVTNLEVVTSKWKANPVRLHGLKENLVLHTWPISVEAVKGYDVGVVSSFGYLIPKRIIDSFPLGMLNVHGSILPRWRGASPVIYAVMHGDTETGITMMRIRPHRFDEGEIISQRSIPIMPNETAFELSNRMAHIGAQELMATIHRLPQCLDEALTQPKEGITYAPKVTSDLCMIDFHRMSAISIFNSYRALSHMYPLTTYFYDLKLRLYDISLDENDSIQTQMIRSNPSCDHRNVDDSNSEHNVIPGLVVYLRKSRKIKVQCCDGAFIYVGRIGPPTKKPLSPEEFHNGYLSKKPSEKWFFRIS